GDAPEGGRGAGRGCGHPLAVAGLCPGQTVLDLGSGGGLDVLLSARRVAPGGVAYGLDASPDMLALARANAAAAGVTNVRFLHGYIEDIPLPADHVEVVISNCVINLSTDKPRVLAEAFRVLRPGGRLGVSDVIAGEGADPAELAGAEQRVGCLNGTLTQREYRDLLLAAGLTATAITPAPPAPPGAGPALHSATTQAPKPAGRHPYRSRQPVRTERRVRVVKLMRTALAAAATMTGHITAGEASGMAVSRVRSSAVMPRQPAVAARPAGR